MKILVTGHNGFIGNHVAHALEVIGHDVYGVDRKSGCDISRYPNLVKTVGSMTSELDMIVHLAASCSTPLSIKDPRRDFEDNVVGTFNILELARLYKCNVHFTSSVKAWTGTPYGVSKATGELYLKEYQEMYGVDYVINRPGTIYGPGQDGSPESGWLGWFIKAKLENKHVDIYGDGMQTRDVLYITDYVSLVLKQIEYFDKWKNRLYEVGGGEENEINLLEALEILDIEDYSFQPRRPGDVERFVSENKDLQDWYPKVDAYDGIYMTLKYYGGKP